MLAAASRAPEGLVWPDWRGEACAIIASGPSATSAGIARLKGRMRVMAIKRNVELAPWADAVYGCDWPWWREARGLPHFHGLKLAWDRQACDRFGLVKVDLPAEHAASNALLFDRPGLVGGGGNSGFQALNLVAQWGATRILLIGFDLHDRAGVHWHGRNMAQGQSNPSVAGFRRWRTAFAAAADQLTGRGTDVVNASPNSDMTSFPKAGVAETLERWGL